MIPFLIAVIVLLIAVIVYLNVEFYKEKRLFKIKIESMHEVIAEISRKQSGQLGKIRLSDELNEKLKKSQVVLSNDIFGLNQELFQMLSKNNLLKK